VNISSVGVEARRILAIATAAMAYLAHNRATNQQMNAIPTPATIIQDEGVRNATTLSPSHTSPATSSPASPALPPLSSCLSHLTAAESNAIHSLLLLTTRALLDIIHDEWKDGQQQQRGARKRQHRHSITQAKVERCLSPSLVPWPVNEPCICESDDDADDEGESPMSHSVDGGQGVTATGTTSTKAASSASTPPSASASVKTSAPNDSDPSHSPSPPAPIRRTVLPFSNILALERNILTLRTARGQQQIHRQQQQQHGARYESSPAVRSNSIGQRGASAVPASTDANMHPHSPHPRDVQLLQQHFMQLFTHENKSSAAASKGERSSTMDNPSHASARTTSQLHPYGIILHHFFIQFDHQVRYINKTRDCMKQDAAHSERSAEAASAEDGPADSVASSSAEPSDAPRRPPLKLTHQFLQQQITAINSFLHAHETLILLSYPHLYQTQLCQQLARSALRSCVLNHPTIRRALERWSEEMHAREEQQLKHDIEKLKHKTLREMGVRFPFNCETDSLIQQACNDGVLESPPAAHAHAPAPTAAFARHSSDKQTSETDGTVIDPTWVSAESLLRRSSSMDRLDARETPGDRLIHDEPDDRFHTPPPMHARQPSRRITTSSAVRPSSAHHTFSFLSAQDNQHPNTTSMSLREGNGLMRTGADWGTMHSTEAASAAVHPYPSTPPRSTAEKSTRPYDRSITLLSSFDAAPTFEGKLDVLAAVCRSITMEFDEFLVKSGITASTRPGAHRTGQTSLPTHVTPSSTPGPSSLYIITSEELMQILVYCFVHASLHRPISSIYLLAELTSGEDLLSERGYILTTVQCAIQLVGELARERKKKKQAPEASTSATMNGAKGDKREWDVDSSDAVPRSYSSTSSTSSTPSIPSRVPSSLSSSSGGLPPTSSSFSSSSFSLSASSSSASIRYGPILASALSAFCLAADHLHPDVGWQSLGVKDGVHIYRKRYPDSSFDSVKGVSIIHRPPHLIQSFLGHPNNRRLVDDLFLSGRIVKHLSHDTKIVQYCFKARNWCARQQTDMCLLLHQGVCNDGRSLICLGLSVDDPSCPPRPPFTRATVRASGWLLKSMNGGLSTHATYIVSPDGNGFPSWVVNLLSTKQPMIVKNVREYLYMATEPSQPPSQRSTPHKQTTAHAATRAINPIPTPDASTPQLSATSLSTSCSSTSSSSASSSSR